jgi:transposase
VPGGQAVRPHQVGREEDQVAQARRGRGRAAQALCLAANSLWENQSALGSFLRRLKARLGVPKAVPATAHKLARQVYQMLKSGVLPVAVPAAAYAAAQHVRAVEAVKKKARRLGLVVPESVAQAATAPS